MFSVPMSNFPGIGYNGQLGTELSFDPLAARDPDGPKFRLADYNVEEKRDAESRHVTNRDADAERTRSQRQSDIDRHNRAPDSAGDKKDVLSDDATPRIDEPHSGETVSPKTEEANTSNSPPLHRPVRQLIPQTQLRKRRLKTRLSPLTDCRIKRCQMKRRQLKRHPTRKRLSPLTAYRIKRRQLKRCQLKRYPTRKRLLPLTAYRIKRRQLKRCQLKRYPPRKPLSPLTVYRIKRRQLKRCQLKRYPPRKPLSPLTVYRIKRRQLKRCPLKRYPPRKRLSPLTAYRIKRRQLKRCRLKRYPPRQRLSPLTAYRIKRRAKPVPQRSEIRSHDNRPKARRS